MFIRVARSRVIRERVFVPRRMREVFLSLMLPGPRKCLAGYRFVTKSTLLLLGLLTDNVLAGISDAFALVGFRQPEGTNLGSRLTDLLLV